ncbi:hypothetical protein PQR65_39185 [Paraburkholderia nemoris]|uniref:hypothetical protein n=1 Tax=Paraburkholderia nemoris TaxID=2793076 RepID=UPI0038BDEC06
MGLLLTLQEAEGWHGQYRRMLRWRERISATDHGRSSAEQLDFLIAFFVACFHLRDWLKDSGLDAERLNEMSWKNVELRICRDVANGSRHSYLDRKPFYGQTFCVVWEHVPTDWPSNLVHSSARWSILAGADKFDLIELAGRWFSIWDAFLGEMICLWTPAAFNPLGMAEGSYVRRSLSSDRARSRAKSPQ